VPEELLAAVDRVLADAVMYERLAAPPWLRDA
jgi:hypothetical protein